MDVVGSYFQLMAEEVNSQSYGITTSNNELNILLGTYASIFEAPSSSTPLRNTQHYIHLVAGAQLVNVKLYGCIHFKKSEIEK